MPQVHKRDYLFKFVPAHLRSQLLLDDEASYSVTDQYTADKMTRDLARFLPRDAVICDATACIGGNTHSFARFFAKVHAVEKDATRFSYLKHNMNVLQASNITCVHGDSLALIPALANLDIIFMDPPWGGPDYKTHASLELALSGVPLADVCRRWRHCTRYIALKTPLNFDELRFRAQTADFMELIWKNAQLRKVAFTLYKIK
jgi:predicted RNA methylase